MMNEFGAFPYIDWRPLIIPRPPPLSLFRKNNNKESRFVFLVTAGPLNLLKLPLSKISITNGFPLSLFSILNHKQGCRWGGGKWSPSNIRETAFNYIHYPLYYYIMSKLYLCSWHEIILINLDRLSESSKLLGLEYFKAIEFFFFIWN